MGHLAGAFAIQRGIAAGRIISTVGTLSPASGNFRGLSDSDEGVGAKMVVHTKRTAGGSSGRRISMALSSANTTAVDSTRRTIDFLACKSRTALVQLCRLASRAAFAEQTPGARLGVFAGKQQAGPN